MSSGDGAGVQSTEILRGITNKAKGTDWMWPEWQMERQSTKCFPALVLGQGRLALVLMPHLLAGGC